MFVGVVDDFNKADILVFVGCQDSYSGSFTSLSPNGVAATRNGIDRLNADGTLDTVFNPNATDNMFGSL